MAVLQEFLFLQHLCIALGENNWAGPDVLQETPSCVGESLADHVLFRMYGQMGQTQMNDLLLSFHQWHLGSPLIICVIMLEWAAELIVCIILFEAPMMNKAFFSVDKSEGEGVWKYYQHGDHRPDHS